MLLSRPVKRSSLALPIGCKGRCLACGRCVSTSGKQILSFFIALKSYVPLALYVQMKRCIVRQGEPLVISLLSQRLNQKVIFVND